MCFHSKLKKVRLRAGQKGTRLIAASVRHFNTLGLVGRLIRRFNGFE